MEKSRHTAQDALAAVCQSAQVDHWDGAGARRVEPSSYRYARQLIHRLPRWVSPPEIAIDRDGEILFEWDHGRRHVFTISIGKDGTLTFAGLFGQTTIHGIDHGRDELSSTIVEYLERFQAPPPS